LQKSTLFYLLYIYNFECVLCKPTEETVLGLLRYKDGWLEFNVPYQHKYGCIRDDYDTEKTVTGKQSLSVGPCMLDLIFVQY